jgi:ADP-ribosyl-[dinitrogen reductase] hydrolase
MSAPPAASPSLPLRNSYWVVPGLLLAGEHPGGGTREKTKDRLKKLLGAGIECFIDLTKPTELLRYDVHLPFYVEYVRKPIKDHGLPGSRALMIEILDHIGNAMRAGRPVYVHCRAGIGRTGTVIGCLLVERGLTGDGALDELNRLWQQCKRSKSWSFIPETDEQAAYVREWTARMPLGGFDMTPAAAAIAAVGPMSAGSQAPSGGTTIAAIQARAARQSTGAGQARAATQRLATNQPRGANESFVVSRAPLAANSLILDRAPAVADGLAAGRPLPTLESASAHTITDGRSAGQARASSQGAEVARANVGFQEPTAQPPAFGPDPLLEPATLAAARGLRDRFIGALYGLAVADAVAAATQYRRPGSFSPVGDMIGGGPFDLPRGAWSDDTAMALCLAESLLECNGFDARDQVQRYSRWQQEGYLSSTGQCVGITANTARALAMAKWRRLVFAGSHDPEQVDPEPLSRIAPVVLYFFASLETVVQQAADSARTTCQAPAVLECCRRLARAIHAGLSGLPKSKMLAEIQPNGESATHANATAADALAGAFWAFSTTDNYRDAILRAANVGGNSDVVASVCGQLAGAHYGVSAIPSSWRNGLMQKDLIEGYADRLLAHGLVSLGS